MRVDIYLQLSSISALILKPVGQAAEFKSEFKLEPLPLTCQSLPKAIPEDNQRFRGQNQWPSSWGSAPAQLGLVGRAIVNSGRFRVGAATGSLEQTCYHSCDTDSGHFQRWEVLQSELASHYILYTSDRHMLTEVSLAAYIFKRTRLRLRMSGQLFDEVSFNITTFVTD